MEKVVVLTPINLRESPSKATAGFADVAQSDLLYMDSILVSTGENLNDDVFLPDEMWKARSTPILKPVDWEHETGSEVSEEDFAKNPRSPVVGNQIIGVMYNTYTIDGNEKVISEEQAKASDFQIPSKFHIVDQSAIYKNIFPKTAAKIEKGAKEGNLFVSMETWFNGYDYLVGNRIVARNEQTVFLDKSLRAKGGTGVLNSVPVKRVLRDLTFGGKGIVYRPANVESVIKSVTSAPVQAQASEVYNEKAIASNIIGEINPEGKVIQKELVMGDENKNNQPVVLSGLTVEDYKAAVAKAAQLEQTVKVKDEELAAAKLKVEAAEKKAAEEVAAAKALADEASKKLVEAEGKLAQAAKDKQVAERRSTIASELKADGDKLEKLLASSKDMSDEAFAAFVSSTKELLAASTAAWEDFKKKKGEEEEEEDKKKKKAESEAKAAADKAEADKAAEEAAKAKASEESIGITDPKILERIKASTTPSAGVDTNNKGVDIKAKYSELALAVVNAGKIE